MLRILWTSFVLLVMSGAVAAQSEMECELTFKHHPSSVPSPDIRALVLDANNVPMDDGECCRAGMSILIQIFDNGLDTTYDWTVTDNSVPTDPANLDVVVGRGTVSIEPQLGSVILVFPAPQGCGWDRVITIDNGITPHHWVVGCYGECSTGVSTETYVSVAAPCLYYEFGNSGSDPNVTIQVEDSNDLPLIDGDCCDEAKQIVIVFHREETIPDEWDYEVTLGSSVFARGTVSVLGADVVVTIPVPEGLDCGDSLAVNVNSDDPDYPFEDPSSDEAWLYFGCTNDPCSEQAL